MNINTVAVEKAVAEKEIKISKVKTTKVFRWFTDGTELFMMRGSHVARMTVDLWLNGSTEEIKSKLVHEYNSTSAKWLPLFGSRLVDERLSFRFTNALDYLVADGVSLSGSGDNETYRLTLLEKVNDKYNALATYRKVKTYKNEGFYEFAVVASSDRMKELKANASEAKKTEAKSATKSHERALVVALAKRKK